MTRALLLPRWGLPQFLLMALVSITMVATTPGFLQATGTILSGLTNSPPLFNPDPNAVQPFYLQAANPAEQAQAVACLAQAVYYEAGTEALEGQRAVAQVVVNRVRDRNFPASVCGVVFQGFKLRTGCQFSFVCDGSIFRRPPGQEQWDQAKAIATAALNGHVEPAVGAATHYHADYCKPWWRRSMVQVTQIGQHIFYTWPGRAGQPTALTQPYEGGELVVEQQAMATLSSRRG